MRTGDRMLARCIEVTKGLKATMPCASPFEKYRKNITDHFSGPGRTISPMCVCVSVSGQ